MLNNVKILLASPLPAVVPLQYTNNQQVDRRQKTVDIDLMPLLNADCRLPTVDLLKKEAL